jgi:hypothetical protein
MTVAIILLALVIIAVLAVMVINRTTGARPDRPLEGAEADADTPTNKPAANQGSTWKADQPGDPGLEAQNAEEPGDPSPGPPRA